MWHYTGFFLEFKSIVLVKRIFSLTAAVAMTVLLLISRANLASFVCLLFMLDVGPVAQSV